MREILFAHTVQLQSAARRYANRAVAEFIREPVDRKIELRRQKSAGVLRAHHERKVFAAAIARRFARVAVVLLLDAMKLEERRVLFGERCATGGDIFGDRAA